MNITKIGTTRWPAVIGTAVGLAFCVAVPATALAERPSLTSLDAKLDVIDGKVDTLDGKVDGVSGQVGTVDTKVDGLSSQIWDIDTLVGSVLSEVQAIGDGGVIAINQDCAENTGCGAGDIAGFPVTLAAGRSYRLTGDLNLTATPDVDAILMEADATLDLNGFRILGGTTCSGTPATCTPAGIGDGITGAEGARVRNGSVIGMGNVGIRVRNHMQIEDMIVARSGDDGLQGQCRGCRIVANRVHSNGDRGIHVAFASSQGALIQGNTIVGNNFVGIDSCERCMNLDNVIYSNGGFGIRNLGAGGSAYGNNTLYDNNSGGDQVEAGGVEISANVCNGSTACP